MPQENKYREVKVKRCEGGWVVSERGRPDTIIVRWGQVELELRDRLYPDGDR